MDLKIGVKTEKWMFGIASVVVGLTLVLLYIIEPQNLPNPVLSEYLSKFGLYLFGLVWLRGLWKLTLDKKLPSQKQEK
ncbi:hypothetical protein [Roseivirga sp. UBA1976]|uniref:hypothetical protein n=1 Tax=Roseivirga sp. UBA1976 TaxID=1947386 RepID=UPI00257ABE80|nr:hypothetical protein [Roseivirga sp. UBA1976]MEC7755755.1 hypothetical protein [Bacteroidota bacterium]|tara:strand:+ start:6596 stop:6829 length:234 start_codon:yes stop_codon:yes gene_type:complete